MYEWECTYLFLLVFATCFSSEIESIWKDIERERNAHHNKKRKVQGGNTQAHSLFLKKIFRHNILINHGVNDFALMYWLVFKSTNFSISIRADLLLSSLYFAINTYTQIKEIIITIIMIIMITIIVIILIMKISLTCAVIRDAMRVLLPMQYRYHYYNFYCCCWCFKTQICARV